MAEGEGREGSGRGYSGSGGQVVNYKDLESFDVDHYDFINAPQFVDFANLAKTEDANADHFFETHREEDDFLISIDNISPTMQLLQEHQNNSCDAHVLDSITCEVNQAVAKDGMNDVQVVYYASPATIGNNKNKGRKQSSLNSSNGSCFYTPMGMGGGKDTDTEYYDNKENCAPAAASLNTPEFKDPVKKLSYSAAFGEDDNDVPFPAQEFTYQNPAALEKTQNSPNCQISNTSSSPCVLSTGIIAQIEQLQILSSDEEDTAVEEEIEDMYNSPTKSIVTDESIVNALLKTPGAATAGTHSSASTQSQSNMSTKVTKPELEKKDEDDPKPYKQSAINKMINFGVKELTITVPQSPDLSKRARSKLRKGVSTFQSSTSCNTTVKYGPAVPMKAEHQRYVSLAEQISKYQKNTPDRFRTRPRGQQTYLQRSHSCELKALTCPQGERNPSKSPTRCKNVQPTAVISTNRASSVCVPMPKSALMSSSTRPSSKTSGAEPIHRTTIPQPFHLSTTRKRNCSADANKDVSDFKFKARPAPKGTQGQVGVHERPQIKCTLPLAPHFASDDRIRERHVKRAQSATLSPKAPETKPSRKPAAAARGNVSRIPTAQAPPHRVTTFKPFSFDQRNQQMLRRKEEKIKQEIEKEGNITAFHANPLPISEPKLPPKKPAPTTQIQAFNFKSDKRGASYLQSLKQKLEEEERELRATTTFHANPPNVLHRPPFEPELSGRAQLQTVDFQLNTQKRAIERVEFDNVLRQKELEAERKREEEQIRQDEQRRLEEIERRRQMVHKAQPFKAPKPFELDSNASKKPLTIPQSPSFHYPPSKHASHQNTSM